MTDAIISAVEQGTRELAAFLGSLPHESSWSSSSSSMPDHNINKILRDFHQLSRRWVWIRSITQILRDINKLLYELQRRRLEGRMDGVTDSTVHLEGELSHQISCSSMPDHNINKILRDIQQLSRRWVRIRSTLDSAEKITEEPTQLWLRDLEAVANLAEDVLDELLYEVQGLRLEGRMDGVTDSTVHLEGELSAQMSGSVSSRAQRIVAFLLDAERRIEEINSKFREISEDREALQLREIDGRKRAEFEVPTRQPTTSLVEEPYIVGREEDLKTVKNFLSSDCQSGGSHIAVMAIVGMGGLGKTTLAQLAYNDSEVFQQFDLKAWVCVSEDFDLLRLTRAMVESFIGEECHLSEPNALHIKLKDKLAGKCFLLVLDDVWEKECLVNIWDRLRAPLLYGSSKSKIIVTTRSEEVSRIVGAVSTHHLPCLEGEHCLQLFTQRAFEGRDQALYPNLMAMAEKISKKCSGVPLVAKILGGQLRWEDEVDKWKDILEGEIWDVDKKGFMPVLRLSYDHLPPHLRKCFKYCSLFRKGYRIDRDKLVRMWMAQGYLPAKGTRHMEDIGNDYFNDLVQRSFIQCSTQYGVVFQMHDLIHDLARLVSRGECYSWEGGSTCSNSEGDVQHLSIISSGDQFVDIASIGPVQQSAITLRSFLFFKTQGYSRYEMEHLNDSLTRMKHLRVLDLTGIHVQYLPDSVGCLKHLRYLALGRELPEWVGTLFHLQTLNFVAVGWNLRCWPNSITQLLNLRHLICHNRTVLPAGIEKLTNLQTIPEFVWSSEPGRAKLSELKDLNNIRCLRITHLGELTDVAEAKKACLAKKERLRDLLLGWERVCRPSPLHDQILETLRPNFRLAELKIDGYKGQSVPTWLGDRSFSNMVNVRLHGCEGWTALPSLGWLPSLKYLHIIGASNVKYIGRQFFSGGFPRLEKLSLCSMSHWKSWCGAEKGECPRLRVLVIWNCDELTSLSMINLEALQVLDITNCIRLQFSKEEELPSTLEQFKINWCPLVRLWCLRHAQRIAHVPKLSLEGKIDHLFLRDLLNMDKGPIAVLNSLLHCEKLKLEWDRDTDAELGEVLENLLLPTSLQNLNISGNPGSRFATWLGDQSLSNLVSITFDQCSQCEALPALGRLPYLERLYVSGAHRLRSVAQEFLGGDQRPGAFPSLKELKFHDMPIWEVWQGIEENDLSSLQNLTIIHCPKLVALPHLPSKLVEFKIKACENLTSCPSMTHLLCLESLSISDMPNLKELPKLPRNLRNLCLKNLPEITILDIQLVVRGLTSGGRNDCPKIYLPTTGSSPTTLQCMCITACPMLLPWFPANLRLLAHFNLRWVYRNQIYIYGKKKIRTKWEAPGCLKLNFGGDYGETNGNCGAGVVIRDGHGEVVRAGAFFIGEGTLLKAKASALLRGVRLLQDLGKEEEHYYDLLQIEGHGMEIIEHLIDPSKAPLEIRSEMLEAERDLRDWNRYKVYHVTGNYNKAADWLATEARKAGFSLTWSSTLRAELQKICNTENECLFQRMNASTTTSQASFVLPAMALSKKW